MRNFLLVCIISITWLSFQAQSDALYRVFTFGNVADISADSEFFPQLEKLLAIEDPYTVLITGDLVANDVSKGISDIDRQKINKLLRICQRSENSKVIILPGDRDWDNSGERGLKSVKNLKKIVNAMNFPRVEWAISKGCPGPRSIELSDALMLIGIDTQWWNHPHDKPRPADGDCKIITETDFISELDEAIEDAEGKNILLAGHFPLISVGKYGGKRKWTTHLSPPIYGTMKAAFHQNIGTSEDIVNERFDHIRNKLLDMIDEKGSLIYVSGHEHDLQILEQNESFFINSGSPSSPAFTGRDRDKVRYAESKEGIIELFYYHDGKVDFRVHESIPKSDLELCKTETLFSSPCAEHGMRHVVNTHFVPCAKRQADNTGVTSALMMTTKGGDYKSGSLTRALLGKHYRSTWIKEVEIPFLDLDTTRSGLTVYEKGGGRQTTSLKMKGGDGREYVFRSVDKQPTRVLDAELKETVVAKVLQDATSMQHPYGAMAISPMLDQTGILHASPKLYILPDNASLGPFRNDYAGLLGMLEEKPINPKRVKKVFGNADKILHSYKMMREQYNDHNDRINQEEYTQARLFDILVGDWGRHEDNWKWAGYKEEKGVTYRPIPRDRDHVFSRWDGLMPYLADRKWGKASGENFGYKIHDIRSLTWQARHSDRFWLSQANRQDWIDAADYLKSHITDDVIDKAVRNMPVESLELSGLEVAQKLKQRRSDLSEYAIEYYELLAKEVDVVGSNKNEVFSVERQSDSKVLVVVYENEDGQRGEIIYQRSFDPNETKEIRLYGLDGNDEFEITGESQRSIRVRVIGGPGKDAVSDRSVVANGNRNTLIYENNDKSVIDLGVEGKRIINADPTLYNYDRTRFAYDRYLPIFNIGFNSTSGLGITAGVKFTNQRFGKKDFSTKHTIRARITTEEIAILNYSGRFRHVFGEWDLGVEANVSNKSDFIRFYGIGNGASITDLDQPVEFYNIQFKNYGGTIGIVRDFWKRSSLSLDLHYENNTTDKELGTITELLPPEIPGVNDANLIEGILKFDLDFRDRTTFPNKGMRFFLQPQYGINTADDDQGYFITRATLENHSTFKVMSPWTISLKASGSTSSGEQAIPFYKMVFLGQRTGLRGYENNRFTGESTASLSSELRIQLAEIRSTFIPLTIGVKGFFDAGRVWTDSADVSNDIFSGYGAGIYLVPLSESLVINLSYGISDEESGLILLSVGTSFQ